MQLANSIKVFFSIITIAATCAPLTNAESKVEIATFIESSKGINATYPLQQIHRKKDLKNITGSYIGTLVHQRTKSAPATTCTTPAAAYIDIPLQITTRAKTVLVKNGNFTFKGKHKGRGFRARFVERSTGDIRIYMLSSKKLPAQQPVFRWEERLKNEFGAFKCHWKYVGPFEKQLAAMQE